jgi:DNA polymerase bacteriophage-type
MHLDQWFDPMHLAKYLNLPAKLEDCAVALKLTEGKDKRGKALIKMFSMETRATVKQIKAGKPERYFRDRESDPEPWAEFSDYNAQDLVVMREAMKVMRTYGTLPMQEVILWRLDQRFNNLGLPMDLQYVVQAKVLDEAWVKEALGRMKELTGIKNPRSVEQKKQWLSDNGFPMEKLTVEKVALALAGTLPDIVRQMLLLHKKINGSATKKLEKILSFASSDGRLRHAYRTYGTHTGRASSHGVQVHNFPRPTKLVKEHAGEITDAIRAGFTPDWVDALQAVKGTMRSAIRAEGDKTLAICDLSSIESRLLAHYSQCPRLLAVYRDGRDGHQEFAAILFGIQYEAVTREQRDGAKAGNLGCGFGMGSNRLQAYAKGMGIELTLEEAQRQVDAFRNAYPEIKRFWKTVERIAITAVKHGKQVLHETGFAFDGRDPRCLWLRLPSGRAMAYPEPKMEMSQTPWGMAETLTFLNCKGGTQRREQTYSSKLVENLIQGIARDVLCCGLIAAHAAGFTIIGHTHDEIVCEQTPGDGLDYHLLGRLMSQPPSWAPTLLLGAEGYENVFYAKQASAPVPVAPPELVLQPC